MGPNKLGNSFYTLHVCCKDKERKKTEGQGRGSRRISTPALFSKRKKCLFELPSLFKDGASLAWTMHDPQNFPLPRLPPPPHFPLSVLIRNNTNHWPLEQRYQVWHYLRLQSNFSTPQATAYSNHPVY